MPTYLYLHKDDCHTQLNLLFFLFFLILCCDSIFHLTSCMLFKLPKSPNVNVIHISWAMVNNVYLLVSLTASLFKCSLYTHSAKMLTPSSAGLVAYCKIKIAVFLASWEFPLLLETQHRSGAGIPTRDPCQEQFHTRPRPLSTCWSCIGNLGGENGLEAS